MRGRSYTPSPPRGYGRRGRSPSPRGRYGGRSRDLPTSLLVRNLRHDCRDPRGFGFVQFVDPDDAAEAKHHMDGYLLLGRELTVVFAEENRKKPIEMRIRERGGGRSSRFRDRRRSPPRYYSRSPRYSRSPPPRRGRSRSLSPDYYSPPPRRHRSRSISPREERYDGGRSYSRSPVAVAKSRSPRRSISRSPRRSISRSPKRSVSCSPKRSISRSPTPIPRRNRSLSPRRSRSYTPEPATRRGRSRSPHGEKYEADRSPSQ